MSIFRHPRSRVLTALLPAFVIGGGPALAGDVHEVFQVGNSFDPADIVVEAGDTVRWIWTSGSHTVTSGANCTFDGLFDRALNSGNPTVEVVMPEKEGSLPYYCRFHCFIDMVGTIEVVAPPPCPGDVDDSGDVDFDDVLAVLSAWGPYEPCPPFADEDVNEDCLVGFDDLLAVLSGWGPCP